MKVLVPLIAILLGPADVVNGLRLFTRDQKYQDTPEASVISFAKGMLIEIAPENLCTFYQVLSTYDFLVGHSN